MLRLDIEYTDPSVRPSTSALLSAWRPGRAHVSAVLIGVWLPLEVPLKVRRDLARFVSDLAAPVHGFGTRADRNGGIRIGCNHNKKAHLI